MKRSDLYRKWARVLDMCDGTDVSPNICVKYAGDNSDCEIRFTSHPDNYEFAVAILEGKPVFAGDMVWGKKVERYLKTSDLSSQYTINDNCCSWHEPKKKTFVLNSVELPSPVSNSNGVRLDFLGVDYFFETVEDRNKVAAAIADLLDGKSN